MRLLKLVGVAILVLGFAGVSYAGSSALLVPFSNEKVKAGNHLYIYYGGIGISAAVVCKSKGNGNLYRGNDSNGSPGGWVGTANDIRLTHLGSPRIPENGVFEFVAGKVDATVSCDYGV